MSIPTMQDVHDAARTLREEIDITHERIVDETDSIVEADLATKLLYDSVTLLHELAASAVRANDAAGIGK